MPIIKSPGFRTGQTHLSLRWETPDTFQRRTCNRVETKRHNHNKSISFGKLREQYDNATATIMMHENQAKEKERAYELLKVKYQELDFACSTKITESSGQCEEGWKSLGLKCYYFSTEKLNWTQSRDYCVKKGGHMVIITSQTEQNFIALQIGETYWIGLNDLETEGQWMWVNSQSLNETGVS
ncbi:C-type lectin domain family 6 member A-like, partial [Clarias magur]